MNPTTYTDKLIADISKAINDLELVENYQAIFPHTDSPNLTAFGLNMTHLLLSSYDSSKIFIEFWETCKDEHQIEIVKRIFTLKFSILEKWRPEIQIDEMLFLKDLDNRMVEVGNRFRQKFEEDSFNSINNACALYKELNVMLFNIKKDFHNLTSQWNEMASKNSNDSNKEGRDTKKPDSSTSPSKFRLAPNRKTDFLKIISAMYDCRMFETEDGYIASNKQELINEFGRLLGENFSQYSASLSQSKIAKEDAFFKPFTDIRKKAEEYYNK